MTMSWTNPSKWVVAAVCAVLILLCMISVTAVQAEDASPRGLFGEIADQVRAEALAPLPSYTVYSHQPAAATTVGENGTTISYTNVSINAFQGFGVYLEGCGYSVGSTQTEGTAYTMTMVRASSADDDFTIHYDTKALTLDTIYPNAERIQKHCFLNAINYSHVAEHLYTNYRTDHFGNTYACALAVDKGLVTIPVGGQFTTFCGILAYPGEVDYQSAKISARIKVYADGNLVYTSPAISMATPPVPFSVDVTGAAVITINWETVDGYNIWNNWGYDATIFNGLLY